MMISKTIALAAAALFASAAASPSPSPAPSPGGLRTIASVRSTPFCTSLGTHFNGAVAPMLANDYTLTQVNTQLLDINDMFRHPDYQIRYASTRAKLVKYVGSIQKNLPFMQQQINALRAGESLTKDPQDAKDIHQVAEKLQLAYNKQMQLATDLTGIIQAMMDYHPAGDADSFQNQMQTLEMPKEGRDIKSYIRFDGQRDVIAQSENAATDVALNLAESKCAPK